MINKLIEICCYRRHLVWVFAIAFAVHGYFACTHMKIEAYPELSDVTVQVTTQVPGLAAEEIEKQITVPLERALVGLPDLFVMRSSSTFALSLITMVFNSKAEDYMTREQVRNRMSEAILPAGIQPSTDPLTGSGGEIYRYTLESNTKTLMELSEIQRWIVIPTLKRVPGIVDINNFGGFVKEFQLQAYPAQMQKYNVSLNDIINAINSNTSNAGGGRATRGEQSYIVRGIGQIHSLQDLGSVVVKQVNGVPIRVRDLGRLQFGHQEREGFLGKNHNPDTIEGIVQMRKYENPSKVLESLHASVNQLQADLNPLGVKIVPYIDRDDLVQLTIHKVTHTVIDGIALVFIVLILFLGSPRSALVVAIAIPIALISVFIMMHLTEMPANLFSLGAIDFGVIVDGSIVVMEAILRHREEHPQAMLSIEEVLAATRQVAKPIFFATLIIISAYMPLFAFERAEGRLFKPMAFTVSYALIGALICSITLIPGLAYTALRKPRTVFKNRVLLAITVRYQSLLERLLQRPAIAYLAGIFVILFVVILGMTAGREFLPELDEGSLWLQVEMPTGLSLEKANEMAATLRTTLLAYPEVSYVVTQLGRSDQGTDPWTPSHMEVPVGLKPYSQWPGGETKSQFVSKLRDKFQQMPGFTIGISQPIIDNVNDLIGGSHSPLALRVYGEDLTQCRRIGKKIVGVLKKVRGTATASIFQLPPVPQLVATADRDKMARYGINIADFTNLIATGLGGLPATLVYVDNRMYNVTVRFPIQSKSSIEALGNLFLPSSTGARVYLSQIADIRYQTGESNISREGSKRQITIRLDTQGRDLTSYLEEAQQRIEQEVHFDKTLYRLEWAGQFESQKRAQKRLGFILMLMLVMMSALLFMQFQRIRLVVLVLGILPMATFGGLVTMHLTGQTFNVATAVGFIALFGVAVQNGIIMVANIQRVREFSPGLREAVINGATERLRPVLMTATVASFGMLPAAMATGVGTDVQRGLATIIVGGLFFATLLTLFILPTYYFSIERLCEKDDRLFHWRRKS